MSAILTIEYAGESRSYEIPGDRGFYIGRSGSSLSMRINHPSISRIHAKIEKKGNGWHITDLGSRNGTVVNGEKITVAALRSGDQIRIGKLRAVFETGVAQKTPVVRRVTGKGKEKPEKPDAAEIRRQRAAARAKEEKADKRAPAAKASREPGEDSELLLPEEDEGGEGVKTPVKAEEEEQEQEQEREQEREQEQEQEQEQEREQEQVRVPRPLRPSRPPSRTRREAEGKEEEGVADAEKEELVDELMALAGEEHEQEAIEGKTEIEARKKPEEEEGLRLADEDEKEDAEEEQARRDAEEDEDTGPRVAIAEAPKPVEAEEDARTPKEILPEAEPEKEAERPAKQAPAPVEAKKEAPAPAEARKEAPRRSRGLVYAAVFAAAACAMAGILYFKSRMTESQSPPEGGNITAAGNGTVPGTGQEGQPTPPDGTGGAGNVSTGAEPGSTPPTGKDDIIAAADDVLKGEQPASPGGADDEGKGTVPGGLAQATPTVQAAATGPWASLGVAFFDFQRVAQGIDEVTANSVEKAISALPAEKPAADPVVRTWLKKKRHEWRFAGAKAAEVMDDASFAPDLLQAARATAADPESGSKPNSMAAMTLKAVSKPLEKYASIEAVPELLGAAPDENTQWAADVLMALRRRSPDVTDKAVRERVLAMEPDVLQVTIPFLATVGAWGSELSETLVDDGLKSEDRAVQLRFIDLCKRLELKSAKNQLVKLMNTSPSPRVKKAAEETLTALGVPVKESSEAGKLVQLFAYGSDEDRKKVFEAVEATGQREELQKALGALVVPVADKFFSVLRDSGRERLLTEFYHPQSPILSKGEEKGFEEQREAEEYAEDYRGVWAEHAWLLESALAVGLLPKNKEIVSLMEQGKPDETGTPSWLRNGPIIIFKPQDGDWKIYAIAKISYAFQFTKTLRRHEEEMTKPEKKPPEKP